MNLFNGIRFELKVELGQISKNQWGIMKNKILLYLFLPSLFLSCSLADKKSRAITEGDVTMRTLPSTHVPLEGIGNVHSLRSDDRILRGASPEGKVLLLKENGVTDILIFRDGVGPHNNNEKRELMVAGYKDSQIHHIPMKWKNISSFELACRDAVAALKVMNDIEKNPQRKLYLHCTMGEDRTGMISGLYRIVFQGWSTNEAYQKEMCNHGFAEASPHKPTHVVNTVNAGLKSLFVRMAALVEAGRLSKDHLDSDVCKSSAIEQKLRSPIAESCK